MVTTVTVRSGDDLRELQSRAEDAKTIGLIVGAILESQSQKSFLDQRLGSFAWPERYPSMEDPFVNIAALVNWTNTGGTILSRFFDRRPALMGTGHLAQSISSRVSGDIVEVGSALEYAGLHQWGGYSSQPITDSAKKKIGKFIGTDRGKPYWFKLRPLLARDSLETEVNQRPFLGITSDNEREMADSIEDWVARGVI